MGAGIQQFKKLFLPRALQACLAGIIDASSPDAKQRIVRELNVLGFAVVKVDGL